MRPKAIITCAITGAIHTPTMSPHLPITPEQIAESAIGAARAGAAIVHLHARDPRDGRPKQDPDLFRQFLPAIASACDVVVNITTGGSQTMTVEDWNMALGKSSRMIRSKSDMPSARAASTKSLLSSESISARIMRLMAG